MKKLFVSLCILGMLATGALAAEEHVFSTWDTFELDTCASAWLIKNFIDSQAEFKFFPQGELITEGIAFDTPDAKYTRSQKMSTFESLLSGYKIQDEALLKIGKMIHDIEINYWIDNMNPEANALNREILDIIKQSQNPQVDFQKTFRILDQAYSDLKK